MVPTSHCCLVVWWCSLSDSQNGGTISSSVDPITSLVPRLLVGVEPGYEAIPSPDVSVACD